MRPKWAGRCPTCEEWNTLVEEVERRRRPRWRRRAAGAAASAGADRRGRRRRVARRVRPASPSSTGCSAAGSCPARSPCSAASPASASPRCCCRRSRALAAGGAALPLRHRPRSRAQQVRLRAERLGALPPSCGWWPRPSLPARRRPTSTQVAPDVVVVDSIQTRARPRARRRRRARSRRCASARTASCRWPKAPGVADRARRPRHQGRRPRRAPRARARRRHRARRSRATATTRCGCCGRSSTASAPPTSSGLFEMTDAGLVGVPDPAALFLADRRPGVPGSVVVPAIEGHRPLLVEVQALVGAVAVPMPRRSAQGLDSGRLALLLAVLEQRAGIAVARRRRLRVGRRRRARREPGADLAVALALASALTGTAAARRPRRVRRGRASAASCARSRQHRAAPGRGGAARLPTGARARVGARRRRRASRCSGSRTLAEALDAGRRLAAARGSCDGTDPRPTARRPYIGRWPPGAAPALLDALAAVAPGQPLREGLDRILQASMGALIVVGDGPEVLNICSGGFLLDAAFSPQRLSELAKMDGAIILAADASRIARANVHLVPEPERAHVGDRHPPPHRRAGGPLDRRPGDLGVARTWRSSPSTSGDEKHPLEPIPPAAQPGQPGAADARALQEPARRRSSASLSRPRGRGPRHRPRRRHRAAAHRDGAPHRRGDRAATSSSSASTAASSACSSRS